MTTTTTTTTTPIGVAYYKEQFLDIISSVSDDDCTDQDIADIYGGFEQALIEMMGYHDDALKRLRKLHSAFMRGEATSFLD